MRTPKNKFPIKKRQAVVKIISTYPVIKPKPFDIAIVASPQPVAKLDTNRNIQLL